MTTKHKPPKLPKGVEYAKITLRIIKIDPPDYTVADRIAKETGGDVYTGHHTDKGGHTVELTKGRGLVNVSGVYVIPGIIRLNEEGEWTAEDQHELIEHSDGWPSRFDIEVMDESELDERLQLFDFTAKQLKGMNILKKRHMLAELEEVDSPVE